MSDITLEERVKASLENLRPSLQSHGGDVEFVSLSDDGVVSVRLSGACGNCPRAEMTLKMGIEYKLKEEIPEVDSVLGV